MPQDPMASEENTEQRGSCKFECPVCFRQYKRREHLARHLSSHSSERPFQCSSCERTFQRLDVLKRHMRTCDGVPPKAGARRRACDRCVIQKKACTSTPPCESCRKRGLACFFSSSSDSGTSSSAQNPTNSASFGIPVEQQTLSSPTNFDMSFSTLGPELRAEVPDPGSQSWPNTLLAYDHEAFLQDTLSPPTGSTNALHFLNRFTSKVGLATTFDCGTLEQRELTASVLNGWESMSFESDSFPVEGMPSIPLPGGRTSNVFDCLYVPPSNDPLFHKTYEILGLIQEVITVRPRNSSVKLEWSTTIKDSCLQFFSPRNIRRFLRLYWPIWHPNINFIHQPTFDPMTTKPSLLAVMTLIGACMSPDMPDNEDAKLWFNCVEELVFADEDFNFESSTPTPNDMTIHRPQVQALQAAYLVCIYQNWEGTDSSKSRVRRCRFAALVSSARDTGIGKAVHQNYSMLSLCEFDWKEFALREELIRLFLWIFLLDTAFVIFNNVPPRMVMNEMKMHIAVPEACFQAMSAEQCYQQMLIHLPSESSYWNLSFRRSFEHLSKETIPAPISHAIASLGPLNLFCLTSAIHSQIFQYRSSVGDALNLKSLQTTLYNWKCAWQLFTAVYCSPTLSPHVTIESSNVQPESMWKRVGFCRYCPEYWLLASYMVDRLSILGTTHQICSPESLGGGYLESILNDYDQTSMRQVNDLIVGFQSFEL